VILKKVWPRKRKTFSDIRQNLRVLYLKPVKKDYQPSQPLYKLYNIINCNINYIIAVDLIFEGALCVLILDGQSLN